jgi:hypothetical protein
MYDKDNDINSIFLEDSRTKKRIAIGIHSRASRRGYIKGGVRTQSDYLSKKEKNKLNGEVRIYNMYDDYKNLENCDLTEIFKKEPNEIKAILTMMKENNTANAICKKFKFSNGTLYNLYKKYGVYIEKKERRVPALKQNNSTLPNIILTKEKFDLLDSLDKGRYILHIKELKKLSSRDLAAKLNVSKSMLTYYTDKLKNSNKKDEPENKIVPKDSIPKEVLEEVAFTSEEKEDNSESALLYKRIQDLEREILETKNENKKLVDHLMELSKTDKKEQGLKIDINGSYSKEELSDRLLSLDHITLENKTYRIALHLEEEL